MPHQVTITAKTGPDRSVGPAVIPNVVGIDFQLADKRLFIQTEQGVGDNIKEFDLAGVTAVVVAITTGNWSITLT